MTIAQAIRQAQQQKPSTVERAQQVRWLSEVDAAAAELMAAYQGAPQPFGGYDPDGANGADGVELLIPDPYSRLYPYYLCAQQDLVNQEFDLYANNAALYNRAWMEFRNFYNRSHLPARRTALHAAGR